MLKLALVGALCAPLQLGAILNQSDSDQFFQAHSDPQKVNHEKLKADITETLDSIESLSTQISGASQAEIDEVRASGPRDFGLSKGNVADVFDSIKDLLKASAAESILRAHQAALKGLAPETQAERDLDGYRGQGPGAGRQVPRKRPRRHPQHAQGSPTMIS